MFYGKERYSCEIIEGLSLTEGFEFHLQRVSLLITTPIFEVGAEISEFAVFESSKWLPRTAILKFQITQFSLFLGD